MISSITTATQSAVPIQHTAAVSRPAQTKTQSAAPDTDTVHLSGAAQARLAAMQEAMESPAQTMKEASGGDRQAQRLLAKEEAAQRR